MLINKPILPPKKGYIEVIHEGEHVYKNIETGEIFGHETIPSTPERLSGLENITTNLSAQSTDIELAIVELYEMLIGGTENG
jgi:hypothetical protein